jgi:predicted metal-dependent hydrolase
MDMTASCEHYCIFGCKIKTPIYSVGVDSASKEDVVASWYREQLRLVMSPLIAKWEALMGVKADRIFVQRIKTKWGSYNPLEPTHNNRFVSLMDGFMQQWRKFRDELNRMPLSDQEWEY